MTEEKTKWLPVKKTAIAHVRDVRPDETGVETLEGFQPCHPDTHFVMRGVKGEEYPIEQKIFSDTYEHILSTPLMKCANCDLGEFIEVSSIVWAQKRHVFDKCAACGTEVYYMEDVP